MDVSMFVFPILLGTVTGDTLYKMSRFENEPTVKELLKTFWKISLGVVVLSMIDLMTSNINDNTLTILTLKSIIFSLSASIIVLFRTVLDNLTYMSILQKGQTVLPVIEKSKYDE